MYRLWEALKKLAVPPASKGKKTLLSKISVLIQSSFDLVYLVCAIPWILLMLGAYIFLSSFLVGYTNEQIDYFQVVLGCYGVVILLIAGVLSACERIFAIVKRANLWWITIIFNALACCLYFAVVLFWIPPRANGIELIFFYELLGLTLLLGCAHFIALILSIWCSYYPLPIKNVPRK